MSSFKWIQLISKNLSSFSDSILKRSSHTVNLIDKKFYIFGGEHEPRNPIDNDLLVFDTLSNNFCKIESQLAPTARMGHSSCSLNNTLYIFGGRTGVSMGETSLNDFYSFDILNEKWSLINPGEDSESYPSKRSYHTMTALGEKIYVFGGCCANGGRLNDLFEFDLKSQKWSKLASDERIVARGGSSLCASKDDNCLYLIGGFCGYELDDCYKYSIKTNEWNQIESLPRKLSVFACSAIDNKQNVKIIVHGGEVDPSTMGHNGAGEFSSDTYVYTGEKWEYLNLDNKPSSRGWHSSTASDKSFYIYGGNLENNERSNELWSLEF